MGMTLDDLRAILANLGQDLSEFSDDEVREMLSKHNALQAEAESIMQSEDVMSFVDDEGKPVVLSDAEILKHVRDDARKAEAENDGRDPAISRLVDAVGALHDMLRRRLVKKKCECCHGTTTS